MPHAVPVGHGYPTPLPVAGLATLDPPVHTNPALQYGMTVATVDAQYWPTGHALHAATLVRPVPAASVPELHGVGCVEPAGQYPPYGQIAPVVPSVGIDTLAPRVQ